MIRNDLRNIAIIAHVDHEYVCTQYDKDRAESLGLLKMDLLGLRTLTVIDDAVKMLKKNRNIDVDVDHLNLEDKATCAMLCRGDTAAVFQMESDGMTQLMRDLAPEGFVDLIPLVALYRPGPLGSGMATDFIKGRHGQRTAKALHPLLEPVIADTYGVILYQEQVMQITSVLGGFSLGEADILRRAMARFNFSHGDHSEQAKRIAMVRQAAKKVGKPVAIIADTKGPEMRLGIFKTGKVELTDGSDFCLTTEDIEGDEKISSVNYDGLPAELSVGDQVLLNDGKLTLEVIKLEPTKIHTKIIHGK